MIIFSIIFWLATPKVNVYQDQQDGDKVNPVDMIATAAEEK